MNSEWVKLTIKKIQGRLKQKISKTDTSVLYLSEAEKKNIEERYISFNSKKEKIRIIFAFQIASFWPNWESFYYECVNDDMFDVKCILMDDEVNEHSQISTAESFLKEKEIPYTNYFEDLVEEFNPHVIVLQTPYDADHRLPRHYSAAYERKGIRVIYIPYGIEIADTKKSNRDHFFNPVVQNCWRTFTFSDAIKADYEKIGNLKNQIVALGHPKFDGMTNKDDYGLPESVIKAIDGRKIMLWHMHFPKKIIENGQKVMCTPELSEYSEYLEHINDSLFYVVLPHPKFREDLAGMRFIQEIEKRDNVYIDWDDDYRSAMYAADFMMTDRSSLMVEAAPLGIPILYMDNERWHEPMTKAIQPLLDSYYHGTGCKDMIEFTEQCIAGLDPKKEQREKSVSLCLNKCDGYAGKRIKNYIKEILLEDEIK